MPTTGWWPGTRWKSTSNSKPTGRSELTADKGKVKTKNPETRRERRKKSEETVDSEGVPGASKSIAIREDIDPMTSFFMNSSVPSDFFHPIPPCFRISGLDEKNQIGRAHV